MSFLHLPQIDLLIALGVFVSTAVTDAAYVFFNAAVGARKRVAAATWSSAWYMLSALPSSATRRAGSTSCSRRSAPGLAAMSPSPRSTGPARARQRIEA